MFSFVEPMAFEYQAYFRELRKVKRPNIILTLNTYTITYMYLQIPARYLCIAVFKRVLYYCGYVFVLHLNAVWD